MNENLTFSVERAQPDLTDCDREPVAFPGAIQACGTILVSDTAIQSKIVCCGANLNEYLGASPEQVLGKNLTDVLPLSLPPAWSRAETENVSRIHLQHEDLDVSIHKHRSLLITELRRGDSKGKGERSHLHLSLGHLAQELEVEELCQAICQSVQELAGIHRVMVYRFLPDWTGEVVAESCSDGRLYQGLRFPATDIPQPAREVYLRNWLRVIFDTRGTDVGLVGIDGFDPNALDLTQSLLRSTSPIHLEYLNNMGVRSSLSGSLRVKGKLWGLVACHHDEPIQLSPEKVSALESCLEIASLRLSERLDAKTKSYRTGISKQLKRLDIAMAGSNLFRLDRQFELIADLLENHCFVMRYQGKWLCSQAKDENGLIDAICSAESELPPGDKLFYSDSFEPTAEQGLPGLMLLRPQFGHNLILAWLRSPDAYTIRWAGDPRKNTLKSVGQTRLQPRASFQEYVENVKDRSRPWTDLDVWTISQLLDALTDMAARHSRELEVKNEALNLSNRELESFAFMASHDLREPIRGIHSYAEFLLEDYGEVLGEDGRGFTNGVLRLSERMEALLQSLLYYAKLGSEPIRLEVLSLSELIADTIELFPAVSSDQFEVMADLPQVLGHRPFLNEIFTNLVSNAIKYTDPSDRRIEFLFEPATLSTEKLAVAVKDNGIGVATEDHQRIFNLFRRLHPPEEYGGGSGAGLTIARKLVERQGGKMWIESSLGEGAEFWFTLPNVAPTG